MINREPVVAGAHRNTQRSLNTNDEASDGLSQNQIDNISGVSVHLLRHRLTLHSISQYLLPIQKQGSVILC